VGEERGFFAPVSPPKDPVGAPRGTGGSARVDEGLSSHPGGDLGGAFLPPQGHLRGPSPGVDGSNGGREGRRRPSNGSRGGLLGGTFNSCGVARSNLPALAPGFGYHQRGRNPGGDPRGPVALNTADMRGTSRRAKGPHAKGLARGLAKIGSKHERS
jgi:hypothetical protein